MTPERALEHDERCERRCRVCPNRRTDEWHTASIDECAMVHTFEPRESDMCRCAERALAAARQQIKAMQETTTEDHTPPRGWHSWADKCAALEAEIVAARQREEEAKAIEEALLNENDRLTLAASESARTLQVEIERLKAKVAAQEKVIAAAGAFCYELAHGRLWPWLNLTEVQRQKIQVVADELTSLPQDGA